MHNRHAHLPEPSTIPPRKPAFIKVATRLDLLSTLKNSSFLQDWMLLRTIIRNIIKFQLILHLQWKQNFNYDNPITTLGDGDLEHPLTSHE